MKRRYVSELHTLNRETGESHVYYLCNECRGSIEDFLKIERSRRYDVTCDRCGWSRLQAELDAQLRAGKR
jgi:hypothetical protein